MPGPVVDRDELDQAAVTSDEKVRRDLCPPDMLEVRVCRPVKLVEEQLLDFVAAVLARREADRVNHHHADGLHRRAWAKIRRGGVADALQPAITPGRDFIRYLGRGQSVHRV